MNSFQKLKAPFNRLPFVYKVLLVIPFAVGLWLFTAIYVIFLAPIEIFWKIFWLALGNSELALEEKERAWVDRVFKKAIAFIELHKLRFDEYPESLQSESFLLFASDEYSDIDNMVGYKKLEYGYELNVKREEVALEYPSDFWKGIGLSKTNVGGFCNDFHDGNVAEINK
ncbi:MAG: hypothetical protein AAF685_09290 [Cyanobacteria bacterium P01_C01_bin.89]